MANLYQKVVDGWPLIAAAPWTFAAIMLAFVLAAIPAIWAVLNWSHQSRLQSRDDQIALLQRQRDDYKEKLGGASPDEAKARVDELERRLGPPYPLTPAQEARLASALTRTDAAARFSVSISSPLNAAEPGERMARVFKRSGWTIGFEATPFLRGEASGIFVLIPKDGHEANTPRPAAAKTLLSLFDEAGVDVRTGEQDLRPGKVILVVARAPI